MKRSNKKSAQKPEAVAKQQQQTIAEMFGKKSQEKSSAGKQYIYYKNNVLCI